MFKHFHTLLTGASRRHFAQCIELPPLGVFSINLSTDEISLNPWQSLSETHLEQLVEVQDIFQLKIDVKASLGSPWLVKEMSEHSAHCFNFETILRDFVNDSSIEIFNRLLANENVVSVCDEVIIRLEESLTDRISATPSLCRSCLATECASCEHAKIGILFSGGIDCTILALLADKLVDSSLPIDLINVSFEKVKRLGSKPQPIDYNTPDRISAKDSLDELKRLCPNR